MDVLMFACYYHPHIGGYELNVHRLAKRLVERDHEVTIVTSDVSNSPSSDELDGVRIVRLPAWNILNGTFPVIKPSVSLLRLLLKRRDFDVVVTQTRFFTTSMLGTLYAKLRGKPQIHVERGSCHSAVTSKIVSIIARTVDHTLGRWVVRSAEVNVGVSQAACEFVTHIGGNVARVIHNGVDEWHGDKANIEGTFKAVFLGRLIHAKGVQDLIVAFVWIWRPGYTLLIVGDGNYRAELEEQAQKTICSKDIHFYGELNHDAAMSVLASGSAFVNPSYSEGLPTSVMEAASLGIPIIATDVGGAKEVVENRRTGILIEPHDITKLAQELHDFANNTDKASILGVEAKRRVISEFSWDKITDQWEELLKGVYDDE